MKRRLKTFFITAKRSIVDLDYYKDVIKAPFTFTLRYHFFLLFLVTFISGIRFAVLLGGVIPSLPLFIENAKAGARDLYPAELVVKLENGEITTNVKEPYVIGFPAPWGIKDANFITIDTNAGVDDIQKYDTVILVTQKSFVAKDGSNYKVYPFSDYKKGSYTLNRQEYDKFMDKILPLLNYLPGVAIALLVIGLFVWPFIGSFLWLLWNLAWFLVPTVILFIIASIVKRNIGFGKIYQIIIHAFTLPILINFALGFIDSSLPAFVSTLIALIYGGLVLTRNNIFS